MKVFLIDLVQAVRSSCLRPDFFLTPATVLAPEVALSASLHNVIHALILKPLPFRGPERLSGSRVSANLFSTLGKGPN